MSTFAEQEGLFGLSVTDRVLDCWLYHGKSLNGWGSGLDHVLWEKFANKFPLQENHKKSKSVEAQMSVRY